MAQENAVKISKEGISPNILLKSTKKLKDFEKIFEESVILCEHCKDEFEPNSIMVHISRSQICKSHYGPDYEDLKQLLKKYVVGKKKEKYHTDPEVRERMKKSSKKAYQIIKEKRDLEKQRINNIK